MTNQEILHSIQDTIRKESRGNIFTPDAFNRLLPMHVLNRYYTLSDEVERTAQIMRSMERYIRTVVIPQDNTFLQSYPLVGFFPEGFNIPLSGRALYNGAYRQPLDWVTKKEYESMSVLTAPTEREPIAYIENGRIHIEPHTVRVKVSALVRPAIPFLDYYFDANRNIRYLGGGTYTLGTGEVYRDGRASGTVTSLTVECDLHEEDKRVVMMSILRQLGVTIPNEGVFQLGSQEQIKTESR